MYIPHWQLRSIVARVCFQILQLQMNDYKYHYLFTTFVSTLSDRRGGGSQTDLHSRESITELICPSLFQDIETFDLEDFKYNFVNITAFRLVDAEDVGVRGILRDMERYQPSGNTILNKSRVIQVGEREREIRSFATNVSTTEYLRLCSKDVCAICYCTRLFDIRFAAHTTRGIDFYPTATCLFARLNGCAESMVTIVCRRCCRASKGGFRDSFENYR